VAHGARETLALGEEAVAWMDRLGARLLGGGDDSIAEQVALGGWRRTDAHRFVGLAYVRRSRVRLAVDRNAGNAHLAAGANDAQRDLAAVCDENLRKHQRRRRPVTIASERDVAML